MQIPTGGNYHTTTNQGIVVLVLCGSSIQRSFTIESIEKVKKKNAKKIVVF
jgi:hypothetical protein